MNRWECWGITNARLTAVEESYGVREVAAVAFADEPITLAMAWHHLRIDTTDSPPASADDYWLETNGIPGARAWAEAYCGLTIAAKTLEYAGNGFPTTLELPFGPVRAVTSLVYVDADGATQTLDPADYVVNPYAKPATIKPVTSWPATKDQDRSVIVTYEAGYSADSPALPLPGNVLIGLLLMLGHLYENREDTSAVNLSIVPNGARTFLDGARQRMGFA